MFVHKDLLNRVMDIGDIVTFTEPGAGRNLPSLVLGEVMGFTKATVKVFILDKEFNRNQVEHKEEDRTELPYYVNSSGTEFYRYVGTGQFTDAAPQAVKAYKDRFYIVRKI